MAKILFSLCIVVGCILLVGCASYKGMKPFLGGDEAVSHYQGGHRAISTARGDGVYQNKSSAQYKVSDIRLVLTKRAEHQPSI